MDKNILSTLEERISSFSKGQKRIARYILSDLKKAAFMTAYALGKETEVSESTVVRFATELGYDGFPQMQKALQDALVGRFCDGNAGNFPATIQKEAVTKAGHAISSARRIYLIAQGAEKLLADYMGSCLEKTFADVHILSVNSGKLRHIGAEDVAVVFSFPPYVQVVTEMAAHCRNTGAKVVGITNGENAPIYTDCDHCLFANADNKPYGLSLLKPMTLVEELLAAVICGKDGGANEI
jgi:DNA-binding MurR/RpiR family transcriptional regulator